MGQVEKNESKNALFSILDLSEAEAKTLGWDLQGEATRALCSGIWKLSIDELRIILEHVNAAVRRAGCAFLVKQRNPDQQELWKQYIPWYS